MGIICVKGIFVKDCNIIRLNDGRVLVIKDVNKSYPSLVPMYFQLYHVGGWTYKILQAFQISNQKLY